MSANSTIEWTDATWNPVTGCDRVSPGCDNCYAERIATRFKRPFLGAVECHEDRLEMPLRWRDPRRVFVNSVSDLFHPDVDDRFIAQVFAAMAVTPRHTYQVLTKRPQRMAKLLADPLFRTMVTLVCLPTCGLQTAWSADNWPLPNVWLGVSVEDQRYADLRIPHLIKAPAATRFLSVEPLLGAVTLDRWLHLEWSEIVEDRIPEMVATISGLPVLIDWCIVGGESSPGARPMSPWWARQLRDQCVAASVPFFFKQWGEFAPAIAATAEDLERHDEVLIDQEYVVRLGKHNAGRLLDGRTWDEYPETTPGIVR